MGEVLSRSIENEKTIENYLLKERYLPLFLSLINRDRNLLVYRKDILYYNKTKYHFLEYSSGRIPSAYYRAIPWTNRREFMKECKCGGKSGEIRTDLSELEPILTKYRNIPGSLITVLQQTQESTVICPKKQSLLLVKH